MTGSTYEPSATGLAATIARLKLTEPVRLYLYPVLIVLVLALNVAGIAAGAWPPFAAASVALAACLAGGTEAARKSACSYAWVLQTVARARGE